MKSFMTALSVAALVGVAAPAFSVTPGMFDPRDPNSLTPAKQSSQRPYALTGADRDREPNRAKVQVNTQHGGRAVIATYPDDKK